MSGLELALAVMDDDGWGAAITTQVHYHDATGQENTPCLCARPGTYARQAPNPLAEQEN